MATVAIRIDLAPRVPLDVANQIFTDINLICNLADALDRQSAANVSRLVLDDRYASLLEDVERAMQRLKSILEPRDDEERKLLKVLSYDLYGQLDELLALASRSPQRPVPPNAQAAVYLNLTRNLSPNPAVVSFRYGSPLEVVLTNPGWFLTGGTGAIATSIYGLLRFIRDFAAKREKAWAEARKVNAEAEKTGAEARKVNAKADKMEAEADEAHAHALDVRTRAQFRAELMDSLLNQVRDGRLVASPEQIEAILSDAAISAAFDLTQQALDFEELPEEGASTTAPVRA